MDPKFRGQNVEISGCCGVSSGASEQTTSARILTFDGALRRRHLARLAAVVDSGRHLTGNSRSATHTIVDTNDAITCMFISEMADSRRRPAMQWGANWGGGRRAPPNAGSARLARCPIDRRKAY